VNHPPRSKLLLILASHLLAPPRAGHPERVRSRRRQLPTTPAPSLISAPTSQKQLNHRQKYSPHNPRPHQALFGHPTIHRLSNRPARSTTDGKHYIRPEHWVCPVPSHVWHLPPVCYEFCSPRSNSLHYSTIRTSRPTIGTACPQSRHRCSQAI
jgi:hypothetical protein